MRLNELMEDLAAGRGRREDLDTIRHLGGFMKKASFCPLGQSATIPVLSALDQFEEDFLRCVAQKEVVGK